MNKYRYCAISKKGVQKNIRSKLTRSSSPERKPFELLMRQKRGRSILPLLLTLAAARTHRSGSITEKVTRATHAASEAGGQLAGPQRACHLCKTRKARYGVVEREHAAPEDEELAAAGARLQWAIIVCAE